MKQNSIKSKSKKLDRNNVKLVKTLKNKLNVEISSPSDEKSIDDFDWKLINLLVNNGRMSNIEIAEKLNTSEATIRRRIENLLKKRIIRGFAALLDYNKLGKTLKACIQIKVKTSDLNKIASYLVKSKDTCGVYRVIGRYNIYTEIIFENIKKFQAFIDGLSEMENIDELEYHIVTQSFKSCPWSGI